MSVARTSVMLMSILVGACVTSTIPAVTYRNGTYQLISGESLRSTIIGKIVTFPGGQAVTGYRCYIFSDEGNFLTCSDQDPIYQGRFVMSDDRICAVGDGPVCWQFFRSHAGSYLIRHLAITPEFVDEPVCIEPWRRVVEPCRLLSSTR